MKKLILVICICISMTVVEFASASPMKSDNENTAILDENNIENLEKVFGQNLNEYVSEKSTELTIKDVTDTDLNNGYRDHVRIIENCYTFNGMIPLMESQVLPLGVSYKIPALILEPGGNLLFADENEANWKVEDTPIKITFSFEILPKPDFKNAGIEIGLWNNGNYITVDRKDNEDDYQAEIWAFEGEEFYPRIANTGTEELLIVNGTINVTRDDSMKRINDMEEDVLQPNKL